MAENNWKQMLFQHPTVIWMQVRQEAAFSTKPPSAESQHPSRGPAGVPTLSRAAHTCLPSANKRESCEVIYETIFRTSPRGQVRNNEWKC